MINVNGKRVKDGWDTDLLIEGKGDCIFHELRSIICGFLSDEKLADMFTRALSEELKRVKEHD